MKAARHLELEGIYNLRDLGGYETAGGRRTRWKTFLRADRMDRLPPASQEALIRYGLRTVIDLRREAEAQLAPNVFAESDKVVYLRQNLKEHNPQAAVPEPPADLDIPHFIAWAYTAKNLDLRHDRFRETLATLASPGVLPAVFHCSGGQDRTGMIAALVLGNAGVPAATIAEDYALSGRYLFARYLTEVDSAHQAYFLARYRVSGLAVPSGVDTWQQYQSEFCPPEAMLLVLQHLEERYGGVPGYMRTIGLTEEQIEGLRRAAVE